MILTIYNLLLFSFYSTELSYKVFFIYVLIVAGLEGNLRLLVKEYKLQGYLQSKGTLFISYKGRRCSYLLRVYLPGCESFIDYSSLHYCDYFISGYPPSFPHAQTTIPWVYTLQGISNGTVNII